MWKVQPDLSFLLALQLGGLSGMLFQPARAARACASPESCIGDSEQSFPSWYFWFCLALLLLLLLLLLLGCCLQCWPGRLKPRAAQRSLVVFAVGETESVQGSDGPPWARPERPPPHLQIPGWSAQEPSWNTPAWSGSQPPPYEEIARQRGSSDRRLRPDDRHP